MSAEGGKIEEIGDHMPERLTVPIPLDWISPANDIEACALRQAIRDKYDVEL